MNKERNALKAGLFMVFSIGLIVFTIVGIKGASRVTDPADVRTVRFKLSDNVGGLRVGDDVRVGGLKVGVVKDLDFNPAGAEGEAQITIWFTVPKRIPLKREAVVRIESTVTGTSNLNIESLGAGDAMPPTETLLGAPSQLNSILASVGKMAPEATGLIKDVRTVTVPKVNNALDKTSDTVVAFKDTGTNATELIKTLRAKVVPIMAVARQALTHVRDIFGESKGDIKGTLANLNTSTGTIKEKLPGILDKVDTALAKAQTTVEGINSALEDIKKVAANTRDITASGRSIVSGNRGKIDGMIASLKTTGDNLKAASSEIRHSPWRLLYKPGPGEVSNLNLYDTARQFADGANGLSEAATALRDALKNPNVEKEEVQKLVEKLDKSFDHFGSVEDELWKQVKQ
jgi:phospholipid/cholesterol/gamma-HCH transport system substrate-binding protein